MSTVEMEKIIDSCKAATATAVEVSSKLPHHSCIIPGNSSSSSEGRSNRDMTAAFVVPEQLKLEVCVALTPDQVGNDTFVDISRQIMDSVQGTYICLSGNSNHRLALAPHLTLYQTSLPLHEVFRATAELAAIAESFGTIYTNPSAYNFNSSEGSFEILFDKTSVLDQLQEAIITKLNPLRRGLLVERDPAGNVLAAMSLDDEVGKNVQQVGFAEAGERFKPHVTINWMHSRTRNTQDATSSEFLSSNLPELRPNIGGNIALNRDICTFPYLTMYVYYICK